VKSSIEFTPRSRGQKGNAFVELSLVLLPLMALILGIVDFSMPIFLRSTFTHAVREGARYGITYRTEDGLSHTESIKRVVQRQAGGFLNSEEGLEKIHVKFYSPSTFEEVTGPNANDGGNIVEVSIRDYEWGWTVPLWRSATPLRITVSSADRLEVLPRGIARPAP
jgi:hypothetical protein